MTSDNRQPELDLQASYGWFHVMRPQLVRGLIREIGETAWAVYTIIKAHADYHTGRSWPSQTKIGEMIGKSPETVGRATKVLEEFQLLKREKVGRHTEYRILESALVLERGVREPVGSADFEYVPQEFGKQLKEIREFFERGIPTGSNITLNLNVQFIKQGDNGTVNIHNVSLSNEHQREELKELVRRMKLLE